MKITAKQLARTLIEAVDGRSAKEAQTAVKELAEWLRKRGQAYRLREVMRALDGAWREKYGVANVTVTTAFPISEDLRSAIEKAASGASVKAWTDANVIGGAKIRFDDRLMDGTVAGHLERLRHVLSE